MAEPGVWLVWEGSGGVSGMGVVWCVLEVSGRCQRGVWKGYGWCLGGSGRVLWDV